ncbi:MAG: translation initiation factor IF-6 [Candidatus Woesearchaeota archaeon]
MAREHVWVTDFNGNPNVGLFAYCTDEYCLVGRGLSSNVVTKLGKILGVPTHSVNIAGTSLLGVFCAGNANCLLLPSIVFDDELKVLDKLGIKYAVVDTEMTALGNNVLCNDYGAIVSRDFEPEVIAKIKKALQVDVELGTIIDYDNVGALAAVHKTKGIVAGEAADGEIKQIERVLKIKCERGSVSMGLPYIRSGIIVNSKGFVISDQSTGIEIMDADKAFGFVEN